MWDLSPFAIFTRDGLTHVSTPVNASKWSVRVAIAHSAHVCFHWRHVHQGCDDLVNLHAKILFMS